MRNKLKRMKSCEDVTRRSKDEEQTTDAITLVLESNDETSPDKDSNSLAAKGRCGSNPASAARFYQNVQQVQEEKSRCAKEIRVAPIFLCKTQQNKRKRSGDAKVCQPGDKQQKSLVSSQRDVLQRITFQQQLSVSHLTEKQGRLLPLWSGQMSPSALHMCLEEIQTSNPTFPVRAVFNSLQKKASKKLQDLGSTETSHDPNVKEKRKGGKESSEQVSKRLRCNPRADTICGDRCHVPAQDVEEGPVLPAKKRPSSSRLSRTHRLRQRQQSRSCKVTSEWTNRKESHSQSPITCDILRIESSVEDTLWTDKYSPQHSSEVIGNSVSVNKLHSWLKKWKLRADRDERRQMKEREREENSNHSWDCGDFQGEAEEENDAELCNTMLITGPPGVGKTVSVFACAQELGFKVFEVNCSSQRSGRHVLSHLKEATQSHLVEMSGKDSLKPAYFKNYTSGSSATKSETLPGKTAHPKNVTSTTKKRAAHSSGRSGRRGKANPAAVTLANFFKMKAKADDLRFGGQTPSEKPDGKKLCDASTGCDQTTATSLILFEEVDVMFDDDVGFLAAIKTFMSTTKRPVILTTNDPSFRERFNCRLEEIVFKPPSAASVCSYLQLVGLTENVRLDIKDVRMLLTLTRGDIRRCLLQLQLWVQSGGSRASQSGDLKATQTGRCLDSQLPPCETGCIASMLGLNLVTQNQLLNHLKSHYWCKTDSSKLLIHLTESWRRSVPLLYSNLDLLLPIEFTGTSVHYLDTVSFSGLQGETSPSHSKLRICQPNGNVSPKALAPNRLSRRRFNATAFNATSSSSLKQKTSSLKGAYSCGKTDQRATRLETDCLEALADFFDLMSYLDATLPASAPLVSGSCKPEVFVWTGTEMKDGLLDEMSEEESGSQDLLMHMQAAAEGLAGHICFCRVSEVWTEARKYRQEMGDKTQGRLVERVTLPDASQRQSLSFIVQPLCALSMSQKRYELSQTLFASKCFSLLGNRQAVTVDYVPILRSICRFLRSQQQNNEPVRYLTYLSGTHLGLSKSTMQLLAEDFS